jgi:hypothetical protein
MIIQRKLITCSHNGSQRVGRRDCSAIIFRIRIVMSDNCTKPAASFSLLYYRLTVISDQVGWHSGNVVLPRARDKREMLREARADCINITYLSRFTIANTTRVRSRITRNWRISTTRDNSRRTISRLLQSKRTTFVLRVPGRPNQTDETSMRKHVCSRGDVCRTCMQISL